MLAVNRVKQTRIIGIDPGLRCTGYAIIDSDGIRHQYICSGHITIASKNEQGEKKNLAQRLGTIFKEVSHIIEQWKPTTMGIEQVFVNKNIDSALKLGQARGAAICAAVNNELEVGEYTPRAIKKAVVGSGSAEKQQIQQMMKILLKLNFVPQTDEADALAIAMCHANHMHIKTLGIGQQSRAGRWR